VRVPPTDVPRAEIARLRLVTVRLARRFRKHSGTDVSPSQLSALTTLLRHGPLRIGQLADREQISKSSVTRLAARLEALGLAERTPDSEDGRSAWIGLTAQGEELMAAHDSRADEYLARQLAGLEPADRQVLVAALPVLERLLDART